jgi:hypothetical protein
VLSRTCAYAFWLLLLLLLLLQPLLLLRLPISPCTS